VRWSVLAKGGTRRIRGPSLKLFVALGYFPAVGDRQLDPALGIRKSDVEVGLFAHGIHLRGQRQESNIPAHEPAGGEGERE
jgi:hypothetical protein